MNKNKVGRQLGGQGDDGETDLKCTIISDIRTYSLIAMLGNVL